MRNWRTILSWEVQDEDSSLDIPNIPPSQALLQRYSNTWWQEFVTKYQIDCPYKVGISGLGKKISTELQPWAVAFQARTNRRELFQCLSSVLASEAAEVCGKAALEGMDSYYTIVVVASAMPEYIDIGTVSHLLGKTQEDIQELFQDEKPRGI